MFIRTMVPGGKIICDFKPREVLRTGLGEIHLMLGECFSDLARPIR
jgi:hypothetical protein